MPSQAPSNKANSSVLSWVLVLGVFGVVGLGLWYWTSARDTSIPAGPDASDQTEDYRASAATRAEQRLKELRAAHESAGGTSLQSGRQAGAAGQAEGGQFKVPARGTGTTTSAKVKPKAGASAAGEAGGGAMEQLEHDEPDPDDIPALKRMALEDPDPDRRLAAVTLLGASDDPQAIPILAEVLKDQDEEVRLAAIQSLADMTSEVPIEVLGSAALNDPSPDNRYEALEALADLGGPAARPYLERALHDPDEDVASLAESLLELDRESDEGPGQPNQAPMVEQR